MIAPPRMVIIGFLTILTACAPRGGTATGGAEAVPTGLPPSTTDSPAVDWSNPIDGVPVASVSEAEASLPFQVHVPQGLGEPVKILVSEFSVDPETNVVALVFDTTRYGRVVVTEHLPEVPAEEYDAAHQALLELNGGPDTHGTFEIIEIRGGANALVTSSQDGSESTIFWLEDGIEFIVKGPDIGRANVLQVVEEI
jgi:hypothetical protein